jgi:hypothetical protein
MPDTMTAEQKSGDSSKNSVAHIPDATNLSWLAETADGSRGELLCLIKDDEDKLQLVPKQNLQGRKELATVKTPKTRPNRTEVTEVVCRAENYEATLRSTEKYDAVFWTESSIDKFLYPYYRAHRIWDKRMDELKKKFDSLDIAVAIAHRAPSTSEALSTKSLEVGVVDAGELMWMTVDDFLAY